MLLMRKINYELVNLKIDDNRKRPFLRMTNASIDSEEHIEPVKPECNTIYDAICFRNQIDGLPCYLT